MGTSSFVILLETVFFVFGLKHTKLMFLFTVILTLNTTPAMVVPVFIGLGVFPPSKRPFNAAFL